MEVTWEGVEPELDEGVEAVEVEGSEFWTFPPNMRLRSLVQLEPFWPFFMVAGGEKYIDTLDTVSFLIHRRKDKMSTNKHSK